MVLPAGVYAKDEGLHYISVVPHLQARFPRQPVLFDTEWDVDSTD